MSRELFVSRHFISSSILAKIFFFPEGTAFQFFFFFFSNNVQLKDSTISRFFLLSLSPFFSSIARMSNINTTQGQHSNFRSFCKCIAIRNRREGKRGENDSLDWWKHGRGLGGGILSHRRKHASQLCPDI